MGGESTHRRRPIKEKLPIHLYLNLSFSRVEACGLSRRSFAGIFRPIYSGRSASHIRNSGHHQRSRERRFLFRGARNAQA
jgi:hypothetical protein